VNGALRWGLLGTAHINERLIPAMRAARRSVVAAVASRDASRGDAYARAWSIPTAHASYDALLRDSLVDAVYVPLPNTLHVEWTLRALDAGKHVLCEKPLAMSGDDVDRVEAVARARERIVAEGFMYRHEPLFARLVDLIRTETVGAVQTINSGFTFTRSRNPDVRLDPSLGGGSLWDVGCYPVSAVVGLLGQPPVEAFGWACKTTSGVDETFSGMLRFPNQAVATVHSGFRAAYRTWLEVRGVDGVITVANPFKPSTRETIEIRRGQAVETIAVEGSSLLFVREVEDFIAAALDGREPTVTLRDSRTTAATLSALSRSADLGRPVQL
jgi:D-xylose 1-dehydrogenase (NADP+, D-xylono-1,5-lactone-forming)